MTSKQTCNVNGNMMHLNLLYIVTTTSIARCLMLHSNCSPLNSNQKPTHEMATESLHIQFHGVKSKPQHSCILLCLLSFHCGSKTDSLYTKFSPEVPLLS